MSRIVKIEVQTGIGLNGFLLDYHTIVFEVEDDNKKFNDNNASFATPYKSISKSAKNKKAKL